MVDNKTMAKTASKKIKVKKPSSAQLHDLALGIAMQSIETRIHPGSKHWDEEVEYVLMTYVSAMAIIEQNCDFVIESVVANLH
jgi:hypothetical protein